jgi:hypothetical protein
VVSLEKALVYREDSIGGRRRGRETPPLP